MTGRGGGGIPPPQVGVLGWEVLEETQTLFSRAGIFKKSMGARNRGGIGLAYRPARLHRLAEFIPWNRFLGSINVQKYGLCRLTAPPPPFRCCTILTSHFAFFPVLQQVYKQSLLTLADGRGGGTLYKTTSKINAWSSSVYAANPCTPHPPKEPPHIPRNS